MSKVQSPKFKAKEIDTQDLSVVEGELVEDFESADDNLLKSEEDQKSKTEITKRETKNKELRTKDKEQHIGSQFSVLNYLVLPLVFLTVTLLGGLRLSAENNSFVFLKPALICLILAAVLLILFFRANLIKLEGWFSENFSTLKNLANAFILFTLFTASTQIFNSLLPEQGLPFWIIGLLFFWTLWNNLFSVFNPKRLLQSLGSLFGLAFVLKYLIMVNLSAPASEGWLKGIIENPTKEAFTWLLDLPRFSAVTGYIQFFTLIFYLTGLFFLKPRINAD